MPQRRVQNFVQQHTIELSRRQRKHKVRIDEHPAPVRSSRRNTLTEDIARKEAQRSKEGLSHPQAQAARAETLGSARFDG